MIRVMRTVAMLVILPLAAFAAMVVELPSPQPAEMPFPEASTNVVLAPLPPNLRTATFTIEPQPSRTNEYAVALGKDADGDGELTFAEASLLWGCDCGEWYLIDMESGVQMTPAVGSLTLDKLSFDRSWDMARIIRRGLGDAQECVSQSISVSGFIIRIR